MVKKIIFFVALSFSSLSAHAVTTIDTLVIYTSEMKSAYSGNPNVKINQMIAWANAAFKNGSSDVQLNLIGSELLDMGGPVSDSLLATVNSSSVSSPVLLLRDKYKPDITIYITKKSATIAGIAYMPDAYGPLHAVAVAAYDDMDYVLAHEVGHILGAGHGLMDTSGGNGKPLVYSRGYGVQSLFVDVMAYAQLYGNATKIQIFSDPNSTCTSGIKCGTLNDNAAKGIRDFAPTVANYSNCFPTQFVWRYGIGAPRMTSDKKCR